VGRTLYIVSAYVSLRQTVEAVSIRGRLHNLAEGKVHICITADEMAIEGFAVLELDEHGAALRGIEEREWELREIDVSSTVEQTVGVRGGLCWGHTIVC